VSPDRPTASELRRDPVLRRWVIIAPERTGDLLARRPPIEPIAAADCPFCPGQEATHPVEIARIDDGQTWAVRVTPDRHPLLRIEGDLDRRPVGMFDFMNAVGAHELVTDTPDHDRAWADFSSEQMVRLLRVYRDRSRDLRLDRRFRHVVVLMNRGAVWSRYTHGHSHVVATPFAPKRIEEELGGAREYYRQKERCAFCDQIAEERGAGVRLVAERPGFVALAPFASEHAYEVWTLPTLHAADFGTLADDALPALAALLVDVLGRLRRALDDPAYSVALHAGPLDGTAASEFHWHWEIVPLVGQQLGMEWATGIYSNPVPPEAAAETLRRAGAA
jgi:UDPglucose--hexose-1-phosphate uridylyltransferase